MAKKATTANTEKKARKPREKKTVEKKDKAEYSKFISTTQKDIILKHLDRIEEICRTYQGINECPLDVWKELDSIVIEVGKAYYDSDDENDKNGFFTYPPMNEFNAFSCLSILAFSALLSYVRY